MNDPNVRKRFVFGEKITLFDEPHKAPLILKPKPIGNNSLRDFYENIPLSHNKDSSASKPITDSSVMFCDSCKEYFEGSKDDHVTTPLHLFRLNYRSNVYYGIPESNKGYQMLKNLNWNSEKGLGKHEQGRHYPLPTILKTNRQGLGNKTDKSRISHSTSIFPDAPNLSTKEKRLLKIEQKKKLESSKTKEAALRRTLYSDVDMKLKEHGI